MATIKFDLNGNVIWVATTGGSATGDDRGLKLTLDPSGNVCVTGRSYSDTTLSYDIHTLKLNSATGTPIWSMRYSGLGFFNEPKAMAADAAGNVYVAGRSDINGGATPLSDYVTIKYDAAAGTQLWAVRYDGPNHDQDVAYGLAVDSAGNVYVTGESDGIGTAFDIATVKYTSAGAVVWVARYNGPAYFNDFARGLAIRETVGETEVYVVGGSHGPGTDVDYIVLLQVN
jgi:outer membrane protein assembly factor BamB